MKLVSKPGKYSIGGCICLELLYLQVCGDGPRCSLIQYLETMLAPSTKDTN